MNKEQQQPVLSGVERIEPELRFPEFNQNSIWEMTQLQNVATFINGKAYKKSELLKEGKYRVLRVGNLFTNNEWYYSDLELDENKYCDSGDLLYAWSASFGPYIWKEEKVIYHYHIWKVINKKNITRLFLYYLLDFETFRMKSESLNGFALKHLTKGTIENWNSLIPRNPKEQQKIANCLSSLDDVINAETSKLDLLQDHKKGLLQQLFPQEGETQPKYRFPEFEDDGDWQLRTLDDISDYKNGKAHEKEISKNGKYKIVNSKFISTEGEVVKFSNSVNLKTKTGDILMVLSDIPNGKALAKCFYVDKEDTYTVNQRICRIRTKDINSVFLYYQLNRNKYFLRFDDGVKQTNLRKDVVLNCPILKPNNPKEEEKIANVLTSASDLIEAQKQKLENLQAHKKGLLQKLFPPIKN